MCIGFSVDFSAHVSYAYVSSTAPDAKQVLFEIYITFLAIRSKGNWTHFAFNSEHLGRSFRMPCTTWACQSCKDACQQSWAWSPSPSSHRTSSTPSSKWRRSSCFSVQHTASCSFLSSFPCSRVISLIRTKLLLRADPLRAPWSVRTTQGWTLN